MKLIHSGKVLKDGDTIESCNIAATDFLVVMITKAKKAPAAPAPKKAPAPAPAAAESSSAPAPAAAAAAPAAAAASTESATPAPAPAAAAAAPAPAAAASEEEEFPAEMVGNLTSMGFPEAEVKACLRASGGNPDVAVEVSELCHDLFTCDDHHLVPDIAFNLHACNTNVYYVFVIIVVGQFLMNGIPPGAAEAAAARASGAAAAPAAAAGSSSGGPLQSLRSHPQFDALRRLVQSNPQTLQAVLTQIGQQDPQLLQEINANQAVFLEMMNEPIAEGGSGGAGAGALAGGAGAGAGGMEAMLGGMSNPAQMAQMLQAMGAEERASMAAMMGLTTEQLDATMQMIGQMPPDQFQQYMQMAMAGGGGGGGMGGMGGGGGGGGMAIQLTQEEMAAVDRLASMGFDRAEAAQAYLACDKNEELAANLLMDGGFGFADDGGAGGGAPPGGSGGGGDGDDMYD